MPASILRARCRIGVIASGIPLGRQSSRDQGAREMARRTDRWLPRIAWRAHKANGRCGRTGRKVSGIVGTDLSDLAAGSRSDRCATLGLPPRNGRLRIHLDLLAGRRSGFCFFRQSKLPQACHPGAHREFFGLVLLRCPDRVTRAILFGLCRGGWAVLNDCHRTSSSLARLLRCAPDDCVAYTARRGSQTKTPRPAEPDVGLKPQALPVHPWSRRHGSTSAAN